MVHLASFPLAPSGRTHNAARLLSGSDSEEFFSPVRALANVPAWLVDLVKKTNTATGAGHFQSNLAHRVNKITKGVKPWSLHSSAKTYLGNLNEVISTLGNDIEIDLLIEIQSFIQDFLESYQTYIADQSVENAFHLVEVADRLNTHLLGLANASLMYGEAFQPERLDNTEAPDSEILILLRSDVVTLSEHLATLGAIEAIYEGVMSLLGPSKFDHPLVVVKIETGSLYARLKGFSSAMKIVGSVLSGAARYGYHNHSINGRIERLPKSADALNAIFGLRNALAAAGKDVAEMDAEIEEASLKLAKQANVLLAGLSEIGINGTTYKTAADAKLLLTHSEQPRLAQDINRDDKVD